MPAPGSARLADGFSVISAVRRCWCWSPRRSATKRDNRICQAHVCASPSVCVCDCDCVSLCCFVHAVSRRVVRYVVVLQLSTESSSSLPHSVANVSSSAASQQRRGVVVVVVVCCACRGRIYKFFAYFHFSFNFFVFFLFRVACLRFFVYFARTFLTHNCFGLVAI